MDKYELDEDGIHWRPKVAKPTSIKTERKTEMIGIKSKVYILYFWDVNQYPTFRSASCNGALREFYIDPEDAINLSEGAGYEAVRAIEAGARLVDGKAQLCFVLTTEFGNVIDALKV